MKAKAETLKTEMLKQDREFQRVSVSGFQLLSDSRTPQERLFAEIHAELDPVMEARRAAEFGQLNACSRLGHERPVTKYVRPRAEGRGAYNGVRGQGKHPTSNIQHPILT